MQTSDVGDLEKIEIGIEHAKKLIEREESLNRLEKNLDFQKIMMNDFFRDNITRLVRLKASPQVQDEENQRYINGQIDAVGQLDQYFTGIRIQGNSARQALHNDSEEREAILKGGND